MTFNITPLKAMKMNHTQRQIQPQLGTAQQYLILRFEICKMRLKLGTDDQYLSVPIFYFEQFHALFWAPFALNWAVLV